MEFAPWEKAVLAIVQDNLPDSPTPYADIARVCSVREEDVLNLLQRLKESGVIRRFGASIRHQKSGWSHNAMVAWLASPEMAEICGPIAARHPNVSHAYYRPSPAGDWPYTFYTMIHGRSEAECLDVVAKLRDSWPVKDYVILRSLRELKKTSMRYFTS